MEIHICMVCSTLCILVSSQTYKVIQENDLKCVVVVPFVFFFHSVLFICPFPLCHKVTYKKFIYTFAVVQHKYFWNGLKVGWYDDCYMFHVFVILIMIRWNGAFRFCDFCFIIILLWIPLSFLAKVTNICEFIMLAWFYGNAVK